MRARLTVLAALTASALLACSDDDPLTAPGDITLEEALDELNTVGIYAGAGLETVGMAAPVASFPAGENCALDAATMFFVCPERTVNGLAANRRYQLLDASGTPLGAFDPATVSGIRSISDVSGAITTTGPSPGTITIDSHDEQTLTGLRTATRVVNSSGTSDFSLEANGQTSTYTTSRTVTNLVLPSVPGPDRYPTSGTVTTTGTSAFGTFTSTMTFNGTSTVTIVTVIGGQSQTCTLNLQTPGTPPVCA